MCTTTKNKSEIIERKKCGLIPDDARAVRALRGRLGVLRLRRDVHRPAVRRLVPHAPPRILPGRVPRPSRHRRRLRARRRPQYPFCGFNPLRGHVTGGASRDPPGRPPTLTQLSLLISRDETLRRRSSLTFRVLHFKFKQAYAKFSHGNIVLHGIAKLSL